VTTADACIKLSRQDPRSCRPPGVLATIRKLLAHMQHSIERFPYGAPIPRKKKCMEHLLVFVFKKLSEKDTTYERMILQVRKYLRLTSLLVLDLYDSQIKSVGSVCDAIMYSTYMDYNF
jgi:hypothetical protein